MILNNGKRAVSNFWLSGKASAVQGVDLNDALESFHHSTNAIVPGVGIGTKSPKKSPKFFLQAPLIIKVKVKVIVIVIVIVIY